jgi:hypothetical protein
MWEFVGKAATSGPNSQPREAFRAATLQDSQEAELPGLG